MTGSGYSAWILSQTNAAVDRAVSALQDIVEGKFPVNCQYTALEEAPPDWQLELFLLDFKPDAVILMLEKSGLQNEQYRRWVQWSIDRVSGTDLFRLFVCFDDISLDEVQSRCNAHVDENHADFHANALLDTLRDCVQIEELTLPQIGSELLAFLNNLPQIRDQITVRRMKIFFSVWLGRLVSALQIFSAAFVAACSIGALLFGKERLGQVLVYLPVELTTLLATILLAPLVSVPLYMAGQGRNMTNILLGSKKRWGFLLAMFFFLGMSAIGIPDTIRAPAPWIVLGIAAGFLLDVLRRRGYQAKREKFTLRAEVATPPNGTLPKQVTAVSDKHVSNPLSCPYLSVAQPKVFISYTHASAWAHQVVDALREQLLRAGADCFLDKTNIAAGSSWRRRLHNKLAGANVFISVTDEYSIHTDRKWPSAEIETALAGNYYTGTPELLMLIPPGFQERIGGNVMPIYQTIFDREKSGDSMIRIIEVKEQTIKLVASSYKSHGYDAAAVLPPVLSWIVMAINTIPATLGTLGTLVGLIAWLGFLFDKFHVVAMQKLLSGAPALNTVFLIACFFAGFTLRLAFASFFEVNAENIKQTGKINIFAFVGYILFLALLVGRISLLGLGWAIFLLLFGVLSASGFVTTTTSYNKSISRPEI